jgi:hypothetical protein
MPNHYHLLLWQRDKNGITRLMQRISNAYVSNFNKTHKRTGALFQGKFRAVGVETDEYLLHLSRYIHLNPLEIGPFGKQDLFEWLTRYKFSSYRDYLNFETRQFVNTHEVLSYFKNHSQIGHNRSYINFVESYAKKPEDIIPKLVLE